MATDTKIKKEVKSKDNKKINKLEKTIDTLNKEIEVIKSSASKVINEFNDKSKRLQNQYELDKKYRSKSLLEDLVTHIDIFESALFGSGNISSELKNWLMGFEMVYTGIMTSLQNEGMKNIEVTPGEIFDSKIHMAIEVIEDESKKNGEILEVKQKGYMLHDRLIRPTTVVVAKHKQKEKIKNKDEEKENNKIEEKEIKGE